MNKLIMVIMVVVLFCNGCEIRTLQKGEIIKKDYRAKEYIYNIKTLKDLESFCNLNNFIFPPRDPYVALVINKYEVWVWERYCVFKPTPMQQLIKAMEENREILRRANEEGKLEWEKAKTISYKNKHRIIGITSGEILDKMGYPNHGINKTVGSWGVHEQWIYGEPDIYGLYGGSIRYGGRGPYLYFENGILTSWQE